MKKHLILFTLASCSLIFTSCSNMFSPYQSENSPINNNSSTSGNNGTTSSQNTSWNNTSSNISSGNTSSINSDKPSISSSSTIDASSSYQEITSTFQITSKDVSDGYSVENNVYTITKAGEYVLSGQLTNGQVRVNAPECKVTLTLEGVSMSSELDSLIYVEDADKVNISAKKDTYNELIDNRPTSLSDENLGSGAIYATCDLDLQGKGSLVVKSTYNNGIHTKDDLDIKNLTLRVEAPHNALKGNDSLTIESGNLIIISTGGDALKTDNSDLSSKGNQRGTISILGGNVSLYAACDGIDAAYNAEISNDAKVNIYTDKYSEYTSEIYQSSKSLMYLRVSSSLYSSTYWYSVYFYNDDGEGEFSDAEYIGKSSSSRNPYYYYSLNKLSSYAYFKICRFTTSNSSASLNNANASTTGATINSNMDMFCINSYNSSSQTLSGSWSTYSGVSTSSSSQPGGNGGFGGQNSGNSNKQDYSTKGIKADNEINISGGEIFLQTYDDAIHANRGEELENSSTGLGNVNISGGTIVASSLDDAIHADYKMNISGGSINITSCYEGIEANQIEISDGTIYVVASDDGVNAAGNYLSPLITISGGYLDVSVGTGDTDGIDSNGNYVQTGGFVITRDKTSDTSGNAAALDLDGTCTITGGTFISAGTIGSLPSSSSQNYVKFGSSTGGSFGGRPGSTSSSSYSFTAGTYTIENTSISFTLDATYKGLWISSSEFSLNSSYTLTNGTTSYTWSQTSKATSK